MTLVRKVKQFMISEDGPTAVEYAIMLAVIIIVMMQAIIVIGTTSESVFTTVGNALP